MSGPHRDMVLDPSAAFESPALYMTYEAYQSVMRSVASRPAETGGILLGPIDSDEVTGFYFDGSADCTGGTYSPNHPVLVSKMKSEWVPSGLDMKGFVHSHPGDYARLSPGDLVYIERLLAINPDMGVFAAPIVIPHQFRMQPIVVLREAPCVQRHARLILIEDV